MGERVLTLRRREAFTGLAYAAVPLIGFAGFYVVPFVITIQKTFFSGIGGSAFVAFDNYASVLSSPVFRLAVGNTFKFIGVGVPILFALSFLISLMLITRLKGSDFFRSAYFLPLVIPVASVTLVFQVLFDNGGIINYIMSSLGYPVVNFLHSSNAFWVLITLYVWKNFGYCIILMLAGLAGIPKDYYEAASIDGANSVVRTVSITIPLMLPTFFFVIIISIINSFKAFREAFALGGEYPHDSIYMIQHFVNNNITKLNYARLSVSSVLTFAVIFIFVFAMFTFSRKAGELEL